MAFQLLKVYQAFLLFSTLAFAAPPGPGRSPPHSPPWGKRSQCRCFPGDACWPNKADWDAFNTTLGGKLIATKPIASACHVDPFATYDAQACADLQAVWDFPATHYKTSSSVMAPFFANQSCDPFLPKDAQCVVGTYVQYAVNAASASDYQSTIAFTKQNNLRLVIRNTGHDYLGKSTGAGAVAIWTHNLKDIQVLDYQSPFYTGKALKMGAGVQAFEAQAAAHAQGLVVVGGNCESVGIAGGYTQGGGHGALASKFGLAADQVLEWEVVTGKGELLTASQSQNQDLYWALSGGGGGTYGVVLSLTSKAYPDMPTAAANLTFTNAGVSQDVFYDAVQTFISALPPLVDAGAVSIWMLMPNAFLMTPTTAPGMTKAKLQTLFNPVLSKLNQSGIQYTWFNGDFPTYFDSNSAMNPPANVTEFQLGGRLIPRSVVQSNPQGLTAAFRNIGENGAVISGVSLSVPKKPGTPANAVNPAWRDAMIDIVLGTPFNYTDFDLDLSNQDLMTNVLMPQLEQLTPGGGAYLNEADLNQPNFQYTFYGNNYGMLSMIKNKYDPYDMFYGRTSVGSEDWDEQDDGRLCSS